MTRPQLSDGGRAGEAAGLPPFWDVVRTHMEDAGIESDEELHRRFMETGEQAFSLEEFKRHLAGDHPELYGQLTRGLARVLGFAQEPQEGELVLSYLFGARPENPPD